MRPTIFAFALLLLAGWLDPSQLWLTYMVVLTGIDAFRITPWAPLRLRPRLNVRMGSFVLSVLLLASVVDPTRGWMIALTAVTGAAMLMPGLVSLDEGQGRRRRSRDAWWTAWDGEPRR